MQTREREAFTSDLVQLESSLQPFSCKASLSTQCQANSLGSAWPEWPIE